MVQYRVSGMIGDLPVDLVVEVPERERRKSGTTVQGLSDEEIVCQIGEIRTILGESLSKQAEMLIGMLAQQNKNGKMALSRTYREVWVPLRHALEGKYTHEQLQHGMSVALEKGMPVPYAKAVARKWDGETTSVVPVHHDRKYRVT
jgi:hypothetical protein